MGSEVIPAEESTIPYIEHRWWVNRRAYTGCSNILLCHLLAHSFTLPLSLARAHRRKRKKKEGKKSRGPVERVGDEKGWVGE